MSGRRFWWPVMAVASCLLTASSMASLSWKTTRFEANADIGQVAAVARFSFKNTGRVPIRIVSVEPSCGCMVPSIPPKAIAPDETGELVVELSFRGRVGRVDGTLMVATDQASVAPQKLLLSVDVPERVNIQPRMLYWNKNEIRETKTTVVHFVDPKRIILDRIDCSSGLFELRVVKDALDSAKHHIHITPKDTSRVGSAMVKVLVKIDDQKEEFMILASVK